MVWENVQLHVAQHRNTTKTINDKQPILMSHSWFMEAPEELISPWNEVVIVKEIDYGLKIETAIAGVVWMAAAKCRQKATNSKHGEDWNQKSRS